VDIQPAADGKGVEIQTSKKGSFYTSAGKFNSAVTLKRGPRKAIKAAKGITGGSFFRGDLTSVRRHSIILRNCHFLVEVWARPDRLALSVSSCNRISCQLTPSAHILSGDVCYRRQSRGFPTSSLPRRSARRARFGAARQTLASRRLNLFGILQ
jgi:hypothetical protein